MRVLPPSFPPSSLPSVTEVKQAITHNPHRFFFYAGSSDGTIGAATVREFLYTRPSNYHARWTEHEGPGKAAFWTMASVAFAEKAQGTVYVLLPPDVAARSTWWVERPILMDSATVENIIEVDYCNNKRAKKGSIPPESAIDAMAARFQILNVN